MAKLNTRKLRPAVSTPVTSETIPTGRTFEGAPGFTRDAKSELFLLAVSNLVGEGTFYERAKDRDNRYTQLVRQLALQDPVWLHQMLIWLREDANMRTAPIVGACEMVHARQQAKADPVYLGPDMRNVDRLVIDSVLQRPDEPGELLAYWIATYGKPIPIALKRGVADAVVRLYTEWALLNYDTPDRAMRFGDVVDLTTPAYHHPEIRGTWRYDLLGHALARRHGRRVVIPASLPMIQARAELTSVPVKERRAVLDDPARLAAAGMTWEALGGWLQGPMDAKAWEAIIPSLGYMALLRNLRNFDEAGVSDDVAEQVAAKLADPERVARSRQFPMRFLSAYRAAPNLRWSHPLSKALDASIGSIPRLKGRTLVLVDTSTSMKAGFSKDGTLMRWDAAALFGVALAQRCEAAEVVSFSSAQRYISDPIGAKTKDFPLRKGESLLRSVERWKGDGYFLGGGTATAAAVRKHFAGHTRVVIVTDEQADDDSSEVDESLPAATMLVTLNLAGYEHGHALSGTGTRVAIGGLSDEAFKLLPLLEEGRSADWPWLLKTPVS